MSKSSDKRESMQVDAKPMQPEVKFNYQCPACTNTAIQTSNKMLNVSVVCQHCGKTIQVNDPERYQEIA